MSYHETSDAGLKRYLADIDRGDNDREWCNRQAEGYWDNSDKIVDAWRRIADNDPECLFALDVANAMTGHPDDRAIRAERLLSLIEDKIADEFIIMSGEELDAREPDYD